MPPTAVTPSPTLRDEIAAVAARLIAEDGLDYAGAKRRAVREVTGSPRAASDCMPDNAQVEAAVRDYQALFMADTQPARLRSLRRSACSVMRFLETAGLGLEPSIGGAIVNGTAGEHSEIHLQVVDDNAKDLAIFLLNAGIDFDASEGDGPRSDGETLSFLWPQPSRLRPVRSAEPQEVVHLAIVDPRDRRSSASGERLDLRRLERLIASSMPPDE